MTPSAVRPTWRVSIGTSRQQTRRCPSCSIAASIASHALAEARADAVRARGRQRVAELAAEERVRDLHEDPGAVARVLVGARGAAVLEARERRERALDRLVAPPAVRTHDEARRRTSRARTTGRTVLFSGAARATPEEKGIRLVWLVGGGGEKRPTSA